MHLRAYIVPIQSLNYCCVISSSKNRVSMHLRAYIVPIHSVNYYLGNAGSNTEPEYTWIKFRATIQVSIHLIQLKPQFSDSILGLNTPGDNAEPQYLKKYDSIYSLNSAPQYSAPIQLPDLRPQRSESCNVSAGHWSSARQTSDVTMFQMIRKPFKQAQRSKTLKTNEDIQTLCSDLSEQTVLPRVRGFSSV